jgi:SSS family solute:Na+ symporter
MKGGALQMWFAVSAMVSGGLAGLFLLAFLSRRANDGKFLDLGAFNYSWDDLMIGAIGNVVLLATEKPPQTK